MYGDCGDTGPDILNLGSRWQWAVSFMLYTLVKKLPVLNG
jgi:hypothetical protein